MKKVLFILLVAVSCGRENQNGGLKESLLPEEFDQKISTDAVLLDVRTPEEYASGFIAGAVNLDFRSPDFGRSLDSLDKSRTYLMYCASGVRSDKAAVMMRERGFTAVSTLEGGLNAWFEHGLSLE